MHLSQGFLGFFTAQKLSNKKECAKRPGRKLQDFLWPSLTSLNMLPLPHWSGKSLRLLRRRPWIEEVVKTLGTFLIYQVLLNLLPQHLSNPSSNFHPPIHFLSRAGKKTPKKETKNKPKNPKQQQNCIGQCQQNRKRDDIRPLQQSILNKLRH